MQITSDDCSRTAKGYVVLFRWNLAYLWLIRFDFIQGLVPELQSQLFQHFPGAEPEDVDTFGV